MTVKNKKPENMPLFPDQELGAKKLGPVECLGMTIENDEERREYFLIKLREKLQNPEFRKIEGFPIGEDEDILSMSDPPYYTACPNPFLEDFIRHYGKPYDPEVPYNRKPFAVDVSEGKTDPIYRAHSYHTKAPHLAIVPSILHYTEPLELFVTDENSAIQWLKQQLTKKPKPFRKSAPNSSKQSAAGKSTKNPWSFPNCWNTISSDTTAKAPSLPKSSPGCAEVPTCEPQFKKNWTPAAPRKTTAS